MKINFKDFSRYTIILAFLGILSLSYSIYSSITYSLFGVVEHGVITSQNFSQNYNSKHHTYTTIYNHRITYNNYSITVDLEKSYEIGTQINFIRDTRDNSTLFYSKNSFFHLLLLYNWKFFFGGLFCLILSIVFYYEENYLPNPIWIKQLISKGKILIKSIFSNVVKSYLFFKNYKMGIKKIDKYKLNLNKSQKTVISSCFVLITIICCMQTAKIIDEDYEESAFDFDNTWWVWLIFILIGGLFNYYLYSDNKTEQDK